MANFWASRKPQTVSFENNYLAVMSQNRKQTGDIVGTDVREEILASRMERCRNRVAGKRPGKTYMLLVSIQLHSELQFLVSYPALD